MLLFDKLQNLVSGLGGTTDKNSFNRYVLTLQDKSGLEAMYRGDWIARKIIDIPPYDETREGRDWQAKADQIEAIEALEKELGFWSKVRQARVMARLYGGSVMVMGMADRQHAEELRIDRVRRGDFKYLAVLNRYQVSVGEIDRRLGSPTYGAPMSYEVQGENGGVKVHPSRIIRFVGADIPDVSISDGWGDSSLQAVMDAVENAGLLSQASAALVNEAKLDVVRIPGLTKLLSNEQDTSALQTRFQLASKMKSLINTLLLDKEEEWERKEVNFGQLPELLDRYLQIAAGAADIPATRLLSQAPQGMNATGDGDYRNYLDRINAGQRLDLQPTLAPLDDVLIRSALGSRPPEIHYVWSPLWHMSEREQAEIFKTKADASRILVGKTGESSILPVEVISEALGNAYIEDGCLPGLEAAIEKYGYLVEEPTEEEQQAAQLPAPQQTGDAKPRTLYVHRKLLNADDVIAWAKSQGFKSTLPGADMHVTVMFSRRPVDWMKMGEPWEARLEVPEGGPRLIEKFDGGAVVLLFGCSELRWRHQRMIDEGASFDWPDYQPHITLTYEGAPEDLDAIEPYQGELRFGPEVFEEINEDWRSSVAEA